MATTYAWIIENGKLIYRSTTTGEGGSTTKDFVEITAAEGTTFTEANKATYTAAVTGMTGSADPSTLTLVNVAVAGIGTVTLTEAGGCTFATLTDSNKVKYDAGNETISVENGTATVKGKTTAGYVIAEGDKSATYQAAQTDAVLATIEGFFSGATNAQLSVTDETITVLQQTALQASADVKVTATSKMDGYTPTLALGSAVPQTAVASNAWAIVDSKFLYGSVKKAGYEVVSSGTDQGKIVYTEAVNPTDETAFVIIELKDTTKATESYINEYTNNSVSISGGTTVNLNSYNENIKTVTITTAGSSYTFENKAIPTVSSADKDSSITSGTLTITGTISAGYTLATSGESGSQTKTATAQESQTGATVATITGLSDADGAIDAVTLNGTTITLGEAALTKTAGEDGKISVSGAYGYKLDLAAGIARATTSNSTEWRESDDGKAVYTKFNSGFYTLNATNQESITYTAETNTDTIVVLSGLTADAIKAGTNIPGVSITSETVAGKTAYTVKLTSKDVIADSDVTVALGTVKADDYSVKLEIGSGSVPTSKEKVNTWAKDDTASPTDNDGQTYTYQVTTPTYYEAVASGEGAGVTVKYSAAATDATVTVTGLANGLVNDGGVLKLGDTTVGKVELKSGSSTEYEITLYKAALHNEDVLISVEKPDTITNTYKLKLAADDGIPTDAAAKQAWGDADGDSTFEYVSTTLAHYKEIASDAETNANGISYTPIATETWVTLSGAALDTTKINTAGNITVNTEKTAEGAISKVKVSVNANVLKTSGLNDSDTFTIAAGNLEGQNIDYELELTGSVTVGQPLETKTWVKGTGANVNDYIYQGTTAAYYEKTDGQTYTYIAQQVLPLITISGLKVEDATLDSLNTAATVTVEEIVNSNKVTGYKVTIPDTLLATPSNGATVSLSNGQARTGDQLSSELILSGVNLSPKPGNEWVLEKVDGAYTGKATYYDVAGAYYEYDSNGTYTYHAKEMTAVLTVEGLKVDGSLDEDTDYTNALKVLSGGLVQIDNTVLDTSKEVKLSGHSGGYKLALDTTNTDSSKKVTAAAYDGTAALDLDYTNSKTTGTVYVYGKYTAGYKVADDGQSISHIDDDTPINVAQITGLKQGTSDLTSSEIAIKNDSESIELKAGSLGTESVKLETIGDFKDKAAAYKLTLYSGVDSAGVNQTQSKTIKKWTVSGTSATYDEWYEAYWTAKDDTQIDYNPDSFKTVIATINGLASSGVVVNEDGTQLGVMQWVEDQPASGSESATYKQKFAKAVTINEGTSGNKGTITFNQVNSINQTENSQTDKLSVLGITNVVLQDGADKYTLDVDEDLKHKKLTADGEAGVAWSQDGTTNDVTYKVKYSTGFSANATGDTLTYTDTGESKLKEILTISGIAAGTITAENAATQDFVSVSGTTVKLKDAAFSNADITITASDGQTYTLEVNTPGTDKTLIQQDDTTVPAATKAWEKVDENGSYKYVSTVGAYYSYDSNLKKYVYHPAVPTELATVSGLKTGLLNATTGALTGVTVSGNDITLTSDALEAGANVTLTNGTGQTYKLVAGTGITAPAKAASDISNAQWVIDSGKAVYKLKVTAGYTLSDSDTKLTYSEAAFSKALVTISGPSALSLTGNDFAGATVTFTDDSKTIKLDRQAFSTLTATGQQLKYKVEDATNYNFTVSLDTAATDDDKKLASSAVTTYAWDASGQASKNYSYNSTVGAYYTAGTTADADGFTPITYTAATTATELTLNGLAEGLTVDDTDKFKLNDTNGVVATISGKVITLKKDALTEGDGDVVSFTTNKDGAYTIDLDIDDAAEGKKEITWDAPAWKTDSTTTTVKYIRSHGIGYMLADDSKSVTYYGTEGDDSSAYITLTGLKAGEAGKAYSGISTSNTLTDGVVTGYKVTVGAAALDTTAVRIGSVESGKTVQLALGSDVVKKSQRRQDWTFSSDNNKLILNDMNSAYYSTEEEDSVITYNLPTIRENGLITITGLKAYNASSFKVTTNTSGASVVSDNLGNVLVTAKIDFNADKPDNIDGGTITVAKGALKNADVTFTSGYDFTFKLAEDVPKAAVKSTAWRKFTDLVADPPVSVDNTTQANLTETYSAGYILSSDSKTIKNYAENGTNVIAEVKGLKSGFAESDLTFDASTKVITVKAAALGDGDITIDQKWGYKIALDSAYTKPAASSTWSYATATGATTATATFKLTAPAYFKSNGNYTLQHVNAVDNATYITITGLKKDLESNLEFKDNQIIIKTTQKALIKFDDENKKIIVAQGIIPDGDTVNINARTIGDYAAYTFEFDETDGGFTAGDIAKQGEPSWNVDGTTATYKAAVNAGYAISTNGKSITKATETTAELAVVKGINSGLPNNTDKLTVDGKTITLDKDALAGTRVTIDAKYGYKLKLAENVATKDVATENKLVVTKGTTGESPTAATATLRTYKPEYYDVNAAGTTVSYYAEKPVGGALATISNIKKSTTAAELAAVTSGIKVDEDNNIITLDMRALDQSLLTSGKLTLNSATYKLALDTTTQETKVAVPTEDGAYAVVKPSTATSAEIRQAYTAGYVLSADGKTVTYQAAKTATSGSGSGSTEGRELLATIKGLKADAADTVTDIVYNKDLKTVTIKKDALGTTNVTIVGNNGIKLVPDAATVPNSATTSDGWSYSGTTAVYRTLNKAAYYTVNTAGTSITYHKPENGTTQATLTGLKSGLTFTDGANAGITMALGSDGKYHITLDRAVLPNDKNGATVKLADPSGAPHYVLDLKDNVNTPTAGTISTKYSGTTVKLLATISAGYEKNTAGTAITYYTEKPDEVLATITGLNKTASDVVNPGGVTIVGNKITLSGAILGTSTVRLNDPYKTYELALADVNTTAKDDYKWYVSGTTAYYKKIKSAYYTLKNGVIEYTPESVQSTLATIKGLKTGLTEAKDANGYSTLVDSSGNIAVSLDGSEITLTKQALAGKNVTLSSTDYTLKLTESTDANLQVAAPVTTRTWDYSGTTATLTETVGDDKDGYTLASDALSVIYTSEGNKNLFSVRGLKSGITTIGDVLSIEGNTVTVKAGALGTTNVTVSDKDYVLALDTDVTKKEDVVAQDTWITKGTTATYRKDVTPAYYTLDSEKNIIKYTKAATSGQALLTLSGNGLTNWGTTETIQTNGLTGVEISSGQVTLSAAAFADATDAGTNSNKKISLSGKGDYSDYTLALGVDVAQSALTGTKEWRQAQNSTSATYVEEDTAGYKVSSNGKTINFAKGSTTTLYATLNGLKKSTAVDSGKNYKVLSTDISVDGNNTITLGNGILDGTSNVSLVNKGGTYTLQVADGINTNTETSTGWATKDVGSTVTAYLKEVSPNHYVVTDTNIKHYAEKDLKTLATVTGLKDGTTASSLGAITGLSTYEEGDDTVIVLNQTLLPSTPAEDGHKVQVSGSGYKLALGKVGGEGEDKDTDLAAPKDTIVNWTFQKGSSSVSAKLNATTAAGYILSDDGKSITYDAGYSNEHTVVTVNGLNKDLATTDLTDFAGINDSDTSATKSTITLTKNMLGTSTVTVNNNAYKLALDDEVTTQEQAKAAKINYWSVATTTTASTATLKNGFPAYYTYDENKNTVKYTAPSSETQVFTISGLKSGLTVFEENGESTFGESVAKGSLVTINGDTVTLKAAALPANPKNGTKVTLTYPSVSSTKYKFELDDDVTLAKQDSTSWVVNGTTATLTGHVPAGYEITDDKTITYFEEKTGKTAVVLATLTGINANANAADIEAALNVNTSLEEGKITIPTSVLGTSNLSLRNGKQTFTLELAEDVITSDTKTTVIGWAKSGANAVYQSYEEGYYKLNGTTGITYTKPTSPKPWLTLTGLKDFTVNSDGTIDGIEIVDTEVTVAKSLLDFNDSASPATTPANNSKVTLKGTNDTTKTVSDDIIEYSKYTLALGTGLTEATYSGTSTATPSGTNKVTYTDTLGAGYIVSADGRTLTYNKEDKANQTVVTITGLALNLTPTQAQIDAQKTANSEYTDAQAKAAAVRALQDDAISKNISISDDGVITLKAAILGTSNISLTQGKNPNGTATQYKLALDGDVLTTQPTADKNDWKYKWTVSGTTATYSKYLEEYYTLNETTGTTITHHNVDKLTALATISGLKNTIKVNDDGFINGIDLNGDTITLSEEALGTANVTLKNGTGASYKLALSGVAESPVEATEWVVNNGTAVYKNYIQDYYTLNTDTNLNVTYVKPGNPTATYVTVNGLAKTVTADKMTALNTSTGGTEIVIDKDMVNKTNITLTKGNAKDSDGKVLEYKLKLADGDDDAPDGSATPTKEWVVSGTTATLRAYNKGYYTLNGNIIYTKDTTPVTMLTITGLKSGTTAEQMKTLNPVANITAATGNITLDGTVLGTGTIALTNGKQADNKTVSNYTLAISNVDTSPTSTYTIDYSGNKLTLKKTDSEYYTPVASNKTTYKKETTTTAFTLTGLKSGLTSANVVNGAITAVPGIEITPNTTTNAGGTVKVNKSAILGTAAVTLSNTTGQAYTFADPSDATEKIPVATSEGKKEWTVSGTTATYRSLDTAFWTLNEAKTSYAYTAAKNIKNLLTVSGLKSGVTLAEVTDGINLAATTAAEADQLVTVGRDVVGTANVKLAITNDGKTAGYEKFKLANAAGLAAPSGETWNTDEPTKNASYAAANAGFEISADGKTATYYKEKAKVAATIKVDRDNLVLSSVVFTAAGTSPVTPAKFTLNKAVLGTNKSVSINGNETYAFDFANDFHNAAIVGAATSDTITVAGTNLTVSGGNGNDNLVSTNATADKDKKNFLNGGAGNDTIQVTAAGYNVVNGDAGTDTIIIGTGAGVNTVNGGADVDFVTVEAGATGANLIYGGAGHDSINIAGSGANTIYGDAGTDTIVISGNGTNYVDGGADADSISVSGTGDNIIYGGAGNDTIKITGNGTMTVGGGAGNDEIDLSGGTIHYFYANGDGNDNVTGFSKGIDMFHLKSGTISKAQIGTGTDLILTIGSGKVTLKSANYAANSDFEYKNANNVDTKVKVEAASTASSSDLADDRYLASSADLIYDDANFTTNDLTDLVNHSVDTHSINGLNPTQDLNDLNQNALLTFGKDDKQNK